MVPKTAPLRFGAHQELAKDFIMKRDLGAMLGIYGNNKTEACKASATLSLSDTANAVVARRGKSACA